MQIRQFTASVAGAIVAMAIPAVPGAALAEGPEDRRALFGETHVHTSWSLDAFALGNLLTTPGDAYDYFKGKPVKHPLGYDVTIDTPLDWAGVTDHSEYAGVVNMANEPGSAVSKIPAAQPLILKARTKEEMERVALYAINTLASGPPNPDLMSPAIAGEVWKRNVALAEQANEPGKFSAFCSYEWTSMPNNMNLHRNVFFQDCAKVPVAPFSALDSKHPTDLWKWMDDQRRAGNELLAISHNPNLSDGRMFPTEVDVTGRPIDAAYAESRVRNEPLVEIKQLKGTSETHPLLSPNDEFAGFEIMSVLLGNPPGRVPHIVGSYARQALKDGLAMQDAQGVNPFKFGFGAASDSHNTVVPYRQGNFFGGHTFTDGTPEARMAGTIVGGMFDARTQSTSGLTGVWAEENTRASIFAAMQRKETFAVSGPQIQVRFFGGWEYAPDAVDADDWVRTGYAKGVPMGGDLPPSQAKAPTFLVWAVKDPTSGNLDRIQIVKGWTRSGQSFEKVYDVVWSGDREPDVVTGAVPAIGSTVDVAKGTYTNSIGSVELKKAWTDPDFDPSVQSFYYARVLEIPTPRWTTIQAAKLGMTAPDVVEPAIQERAWSSPIWYAPSAAAAKAAKRSPTVADLVKQGAVALDDAQLEALVAQRSVWFENQVTGDKQMIVYGALGKGASPAQLTPEDPGWVSQRFPERQGTLQLRYVGRNAEVPSLTVEAAEGSYLGLTRSYTIGGGKIHTDLAGTPIEIAVYKVGDGYVAARSNEFGYANYAITQAPAQLSPLAAEPGKAAAQ